jgi:hypothetical protein
MEDESNEANLPFVIPDGQRPIRDPCHQIVRCTPAALMLHSQPPWLAKFTFSNLRKTGRGKPEWYLTWLQGSASISAANGSNSRPGMASNVSSCISGIWTFATQSSVRKRSRDVGGFGRSRLSRMTIVSWSNCHRATVTIDLREHGSRIGLWPSGMTTGGSNALSAKRPFKRTQPTPPLAQNSPAAPSAWGSSPGTTGRR